MMTFVKIYIAGYVLATLMTMGILLMNEFEEPKWIKVVFSFIVGLMSWIIVLIYILFFIIDKEKK